MTIDTIAPHPRRAILAAGLGGLGALVAQALGRPSQVLAGSDGDVVLGATNTSANPTYINSSAGGTALVGQVPSGLGSGVAASADAGAGVHSLSNTGDGVYGESSSGYGVHGYGVSNVGVYGESSSHPGVVGHSDSSFGVSGSSPNGTGVYGSSGSGSGVVAYSNATGAAAARAWSAGNSTGLIGYSGDTPPASVANTGLFGVATQDSTARGVLGQTAAGTGIHGWTGAGAVPGPSPQTGVYGRCDIGTSSRGVSGYSASGTGMWGNTAGGTGLYGAASSSTGYALKTSGRLAFGKVSGVATIAANTLVTSAIATGTDVTTNSYVLFSPQGDPGTRRFWATLDTTNNTVTIHTNASSASAFKVAWLLVG
jgi:hypothetical protein